MPIFDVVLTATLTRWSFRCIQQMAKAQNSKAGGTQDELAESVVEEQAVQSDLTVGRMGDAGRCWTLRRRWLTRGGPQNCASSRRKRASGTSLS